MTVKRSWRWLVVLMMILIVWACGGGGGGSSSEVGGGSEVTSTGTLSVEMVDATIPGFRAIYITVEEIQAHPAEGEGWVTVGVPHRTVDLLSLTNGVRLELGVAELAAGHYTQLRLLLSGQPDGGLNLLGRSHPFANYFIDETDGVKALKVPSGLQSGVKVVKGFDINENQTTELLLDFNAARSVVQAGSSGQCLLKPVIKVLDTAGYSIVSGTVRDEGGAPVAGVVVSAQSNAGGSGVDPRDEVIVHASTLTGADGSYKLFLAPGSYNLVAVRSAVSGAYGPVCSPLDAMEGTIHSGDFVLGFTDQVGTVTGEVNIAEADPDQHATLAFRQSALCGPSTALIEVASVNVAAGSTYSLPLPAGSWRAVGWSFGLPTVVADPDPIVTAGEPPTTVNFTFLP